VSAFNDGWVEDLIDSLEYEVPTYALSAKGKLVMTMQDVAPTFEQVAAAAEKLAPIMGLAGIFDALDTAAALTAQLNSRHPACPVTLTVAGPFRSDTDATEFHNAVAAARASLPTNLQPLFSVNLPGFTGPDEKKALLAAADLFVFPTRYENEGLPLTILEALAFGLPVLSTQWRGIPEALPPDYPWLAHPDNLTQLPALAADALVADPFLPLRSWFTKGFTLESHLAQILALLVPPNNPTSP
jgi:glycosyltransferase involved in cell wall biosynthesis